MTHLLNKPYPIIGLLLVLLFSSHFKLKAQENNLEQICNLQFSKPKEARQLQLKHDLALYRERVVIKGRIRYRQWLFSCHSNLNFTSKVDELEQYYKGRGERVSHYKKFLLPTYPSIEAASLLLLRISKGKKLFTREVYFATRDYEYHLHLIPENIKSPRMAADLINSRGAKTAIQEVLLGLKFQTSPKVTISESTYQWRLVGIFIFFVLLFILVLILVLRKRKKK